SLQLASVALCRDDLEALARHANPASADSAARGHGECLLCNGVPIFEAGKADVGRMDFCELGELLRHPHRVRVALADAQEPMLAVPVRLEAQPLADYEILGSGFEARLARGTGVGAGQLVEVFRSA